MKTNSGAKKRFRLTGTGKIKRKQANKSHILTKKVKNVSVISPNGLSLIRVMRRV